MPGSRDGRGFHQPLTQQEDTMTPSSTPNRPSHQLVRYYGDGKNAPRANVGAIWQGEEGRLTIILNTLQGQIRLTAFPAEQDTSQGGAA